MSNDQRYAECANYWQTTVHPAKSQGEIIEMLDSFGVEQMQVSQGQAGDRMAWLVRFTWLGATYRFAFSPLACEFPNKESSFGGNRRKHHAQARYQMGRIALHFVKAILTAAEAHPHALFGFMELPGIAHHSDGMPMTAGELDVSGLAQSLPELTMASTPLLTQGRSP